MITISIFLPFLAYTAACINLGLVVVFLLNGRKKTDASAITTLATVFLLGQGVLGLVWLIAGLAGVFNLKLVLPVLMVSILTGMVFYKELARSLWCQLTRIYKETRSLSWGWQGIALLTLVLCLYGVFSLGAFLLEDASNYYFTVPKVMAETHRLVIIPNKENYDGTGYQAESQYAALMLLGSPDAARLFAWPTTLAGAAMLVSICAQAGIRRRGQWIALAIMLTSSAIHVLLGKGKTDLFPMAFGIAVFYWLLRGDRIGNRIAGALLGFCFLGKIVYLATLLPAVIVVLALQGVRLSSTPGSFRNWIFAVFKHGIEVGFWMFLAFVPITLISNLALFNKWLVLNPLGRLFMGWDWELRSGNVPLHLYITYPLFLTFGRLAYGQLGNLSVLQFAFLPLAFFLPKPKWKASNLVVITMGSLFGLVCYFAIYPTIISPRFYMAALFLTIPAIVHIAEYVLSTEKSPRLLTFTIMASIYVVLVSCLRENMQGEYYNSIFMENTYSLLSGNMSYCGLQRGSFNKPRCSAAQAVNRWARSGDRMLSFVVHNYFFRSDLIMCANQREMSEYLRDTGQEPALKWEDIYVNNYQFLVIDKFYVNELVMQDLPFWVKLEELYHDDQVQAYRISYVSPPSNLPAPKVVCHWTSDAGWKLSDLPASPGGR